MNPKAKCKPCMKCAQLFKKNTDKRIKHMMNCGLKPTFFSGMLAGSFALGCGGNQSQTTAPVQSVMIDPPTTAAEPPAQTPTSAASAKKSSGPDCSRALSTVQFFIESARIENDGADSVPVSTRFETNDVYLRECSKIDSVRLYFELIDSQSRTVSTHSVIIGPNLFNRSISNLIPRPESDLCGGEYAVHAKALMSSMPVVPQDDYEEFVRFGPTDKCNK